MDALTQDEIEQFIELGYVVIRNAFPAELAAEICPLVWQLTGCDASDPTTWTKPSVHVKQFLVGPPFEKVYTQRFRSAVDQLLGAGRWVVPNRSGWWPVRFPGFASGPWQPPTAGWHVDGTHQHQLDSSEQGLLGILIFSQIAPGDGGTAIRIGSHKTAIRVLAEVHPQGLAPAEMSARVDSADRGQVLEITGQPGDVALMHPLMLHSASANTGRRVRIITNKCFPLHERMNLQRTVGRDHSPVEEAILRALKGRDGDPSR